MPKWAQALHSHVVHDTSLPHLAHVTCQAQHPIVLDVRTQAETYLSVHDTIISMFSVI